MLKLGDKYKWDLRHENPKRKRQKVKIWKYFISNPRVLLGGLEPHHWIRPEEEKQLAVMIQKET